MGFIHGFHRARTAIADFAISDTSVAGVSKQSDLETAFNVPPVLPRLPSFDSSFGLDMNDDWISVEVQQRASLMATTGNSRHKRTDTDAANARRAAVNHPFREKEAQSLRSFRFGSTSPAQETSRSSRPPHSGSEARPSLRHKKNVFRTRPSKERSILTKILEGEHAEEEQSDSGSSSDSGYSGPYKSRMGSTLRRSNEIVPWIRPYRHAPALGPLTEDAVEEPPFPTAEPMLRNADDAEESPTFAYLSEVLDSDVPAAIFDDPRGEQISSALDMTSVPDSSPATAPAVHTGFTSTSKRPLRSATRPRTHSAFWLNNMPTEGWHGRIFEAMQGRVHTPRPAPARVVPARPKNPLATQLVGDSVPDLAALSSNADDSGADVEDVAHLESPAAVAFPTVAPLLSVGLDWQRAPTPPRPSTVSDSLSADVDTGTQQTRRVSWTPGMKSSLDRSRTVVAPVRPPTPCRHVFEDTDDEDRGDDAVKTMLSPSAPRKRSRTTLTKAKNAAVRVTWHTLSRKRSVALRNLGNGNLPAIEDAIVVAVENDERS